MKLISEFCLSLPIEISKNIEILNKDFNVNLLTKKEYNRDYLYDKPEKVVFEISRTDLIFFQIIPFFEKYEFFSRKGLDFQIWAILYIFCGIYYCFYL